MNSTQSWRLVRDGASTGARNMAVDETLLRSAARGVSTLRFYNWHPHCLSLGRLQKAAPAAAFEGEFGVDVVRRPTGGRAVWHAHEITYALAMPLDALPPDARSVSGAYRWLSDGFSEGLRALGLPVQMAAQGVRTQGPNCFAASASCDFLVEGKKLIGAAQCRRDDALLQHGSLLLSIDQSQWQGHAGGPMNDAISLSDLGVNVGDENQIEKVIAQLCRGFERVTDADLRLGMLSPAEERAAELLVAAKYCNELWTQTGQEPGREQGAD